MTSITDTYNKVPYQMASLIFFHLDSNMTNARLLRSIKRLKVRPKKARCVDFTNNESFIHCGIVSFAREEEAQRLYEKLRKEEERGDLGAVIHGIPGAQLGLVSVRWFVDTTLDADTKWTGIVIRNLKHGYTKD